MIKPWLHILTAPRATMRSILDSESNRGRILLPLLIGLLTTPSIALSVVGSFPNNTLLVWVLCAVLSVLGYWMYIHAYGIGYRWIGSWIGGQGSLKEVTNSLCWAQIPYIYIGLIFLPIHFIFRDILYPELDLFAIMAAPTDALALTQQLTPTYYLINILLFIPCIVAYIISLKLLGEAHSFSAGKAFGVKLIAVALHIPIFGILFMIPLGIMVALILFTG